VAVSRPDLFTSRGANNLYENFIHSLLNCSLEYFNIKLLSSKSCRKWWWDSSLKQAKARSLSLFNEWKLADFNPSAQEAVNYNQSKKFFKHLVQTKKKESKDLTNSQLVASMLKHDSKNFWHQWNCTLKNGCDFSKYKFKNCQNDLEIANRLADSHRLNCSPNNYELNDHLKDEYGLNKQSLLYSHLYNPIVLDCEAISKAIGKIADGTTPGHDSIGIEHFKFAHPCVQFIFASILNIFLSIGELPLDFGLGIVTPIPKFKGTKRNVSVDDFRSITLNVIASKIFEHCALPFLTNLTSSSRQFGFKKGTSCLNAISVVRKTVQFFNKRGSTVSMAMVDVKKVFDF